MLDLISDSHAAAGYLVFVTGILQFLLKKGGKTHRLIGKVYFLTWVVLMITGTILGSLMIAFLGFFGFYFALSGLRFAQVKNIPESTFDKIQQIAGLSCSLAMLLSAALLIQNGNFTFGVVFTVFGLLFGLSVFQDFKITWLKKPRSNRQSHRMYWFIEHYGRMTISFIAAITAFSAIQNVTGIVVINWLWPTVAGTVFIVIMNRKYERKFGM